MPRTWIDFGVGHEIWPFILANENEHIIIKPVMDIFCMGNIIEVLRNGLSYYLVIRNIDSVAF